LRARVHAWTRLLLLVRPASGKTIAWMSCALVVPVK
jgi:hypothetical protein